MFQEGFGAHEHISVELKGDSTNDYVIVVGDKK